MMNRNKLKVVWLCPYPVQLIEKELGINKKIKSHSASWIINLSRQLVKRDDVELHILSYMPYISELKEFKKDNIHFHIYNYTFPFTQKGFPVYFRWDIITKYRDIIKRMLKSIREIDPDIVHAHGTENAYSLTAYKSKYPNVTSIQGIIKEYHAINPNKAFKKQIPIELFTVRKNRHFGCRTSWDEGFIRQYNEHATVHLMPEAVNEIFFEKQWDRKDIENYVLFVGSLIERKGIEALINAIGILHKQESDVRLKVVGSGSSEYTEKLNSLCKSMDIESKVDFLGNKNSEEIATLLQKASAFVLPTFLDNSPNSLAEAMAVGSPCIASNVGGIPSMIDNGTDGILSEVNNSENIAENIKSLFLDRVLSSLLSKNARKRAYERNYPRNVAIQTLKVYNKILTN